ncbi:ABC transporter permease [Mycolicibacterium sp.]|uniref:ABC transporter permease n=1 Tax=Mycolicibacterium sp. TaxID=2320850 RepID=UPI0037CAF863
MKTSDDRGAAVATDAAGPTDGGGGHGRPATERPGSAGYLGSPTLHFIARRLVSAAVLLLVVSVLSFVLLALTPGDAARAILGTQGTAEQYAALRAHLGLDEPLVGQYWSWLSDAVRGDLGQSLFTSQSVIEAIHQRLPVTLSLILGALVLSLVFGVGLGVLSAVRGGLLSRIIDGFAMITFAMPTFWLGSLLITLFAVRLGWFPATGYVEFSHSPGGWFVSLVLPITALITGGAAAVAKQAREAMLNALASEHIRMLWATGIPPRSIVFRHALRNASLPVVTVVGWLFVNFLGGSVYVETVFALPGLGVMTVNASTQHDIPVIQGAVVYITALVVLVNLLVDLTYHWLDPRVRIQ